MLPRELRCRSALQLSGIFVVRTGGRFRAKDLDVLLELGQGTILAEDSYVNLRPEVVMEGIKSRTPAFLVLPISHVRIISSE
jgi:hypothetical protein